MHRSRRLVVASTVGLLVGAIAYFSVLLNFGLNPTRTAVQLGYASNFFDIQARAFLAGHIDVPTGSLGIEGFVIDGKTYMYFPPFPALLRIPVMLVTHAFDGRLSLVSMGLAWIVFAIMTVALVWLVRRCLTGDRPVSRFEAVAASIFIAAATGGTVITFDASLPWVYHEVYLWAVALVVGAIYWLIKVVTEPSRSHVLWLVAFTLAAALTRTTGGWAVCATTIGVSVWFALGRCGPEHQAAWRRTAAAGAIPLAVAATYNLVKFHHPYLFPLQDQVWTTVNAHRREALAVNGGTITGPQFFLTSLVNYFRPDGIRFIENYPFITLPAEPAPAYGGAFLDQHYRTGSVTAFMPLLLLLTLAAIPALVRRTDSPPRRALRPAFIAGVLVAGGVMAYGYVAFRYTSEFMPGLVVGGAIGLWALCGRLERERSVVRLSSLALASLLALFGMAANVLTGQQAAAVTHRGQELRDYIGLQDRISGGPGTAFSRTITQSDSLPADAPTDQLHIIGACDALYLGTGDQYEPWVLVERRAEVVQVRVPDRLKAGRSLLFSIQGSARHEVYLETNADQFARITISNDGGDYGGPWFALYGESTFRVGVGFESDIGYAVVSSTPGGFVGYVPFIEWDEDWKARPGQVSWSFDQSSARPDQGIVLNRIPGLPLPLCERLADESR